jgi:ATP/maltotriose-dependent transcriptional regulator MalT
VRGLFEEGVALFRDAANALKAAIGAASTTAPSDPELVWTLGHIVSLYGNRAARCGHFGEARALLHEAYMLLHQRNDRLLHSGTLAWLGYTAYLLGDYGAARDWLTRNIQLSRAHGDTYFLARSESILALVAQAQGEHEEALALAQAGVDDWRANGHPCSLAMGLWVASDVLLQQGATARAEQAAREGLHLGAWLKDPWSTGAALLQLGTIALGRGDAREAQSMVEESLGIFTELGDPWSRGRALIALGQIAQVQGRRDGARERFEQVLQIARAAELDPLVLEAQYRLAVLIALDTPVAALAFLDQIVAHPAAESMTRERANRLRNDVRAAERGTTTIHRTVTGEHGDAHPRSSQPAPTQSRYELGSERLSVRELEVLRLIASGKTNTEVAHVLVVAVSTVKSHTNSIFGKLQVTSRREAIVRAREMHLL